MDKEDILIVKKRDEDKIKFKVCKKHQKGWSPAKYEKIIAGKDYKMLAFLIYDLNSMGYPMDRAYLKFKELFDKPELFFL